ncbi:MAG: hypothetical protein HOI88_08100 [Phycisphaerae bacterium]|nr:hypothetical protein [Phycisphaerae bacterium]
MNNKGTIVWEQYIEYAVLVLALAVMGWFAWGAFGTQIKVREGKHSLTTESVNDELLSTALNLELKLRDGSPSPIVISQPAPLGSAFSNQRASSISPNNRVVFPTIDMTADIDSVQTVQSELRMYIVPSIQAPSEIRNHQWFGTIAESEIDSIDLLGNGIAGPPHDTTWVQVAAKFDIDAVVESFSASTEEFDSIPSQWYEDGADVFDIVMERQVLTAGSWSDFEVVSVLPGHLSYREKLANGDVDAIERDVIVSQLRNGEQDKIVSPEFYTLKGAKPDGLLTPELWEGEEAEVDDSPTGALRKQLAKVEKKITSQAKKIKKIEEQIDEERKGGGGAPLGGGMPAGGSSKLEKLRIKLAKENDNLADLFEEKQTIEDEIDVIEEESEISSETILSGDLWVWAHDMTVEPGKTYRYRMTLQLANPFFGHKPSLYDEQKSLAESVTIASSTSAWTDAIEVQKSRQWFVVDSKMSDEGFSPSPSDRGYVTVETFEFSDGAWQSNERSVSVGQPLEDTAIEGEEVWFILDVFEDTAGKLVLLQSIDSNEVLVKRPGIESLRNDLRQLQQQVRSQDDAQGPEDETDEPVMPPTGPRGGGGGAGSPGSF